MPPATVTGGGLEVDVVVVTVGFGALVVQCQVDVALPQHVFDQRLGLHDLLDAGQFNRLGRLAIGQDHLAVFTGLQRLGLLAGVGVLLDQQFLVALQGLDLLPVQRDGATVFGLQHQLATVEDLDLAAEPVAVLHPYGIGHRRGADTGHHKAQQGSRIHRHYRNSGSQKNRALSRYPPAEQGLTQPMPMSSIRICAPCPLHCPATPR